MLSETNASPTEDVASALRKVLNTHGHGFHYAVLQRAFELSRGELSYWDYITSELPVAAGQGETRIDFLLKRRHQDAYLVAECKRANPATSNWCFVRAPRMGSSGTGRRIIVESMFRDGTTGLFSGGESLCWSSDAFHLSFELRADRPGDSGGPGRGLIEDAAGQVMKGVNGLVKFFVRKQNLLIVNAKTLIIPVIFTTAKLFVSDIDLRTADLATGNVLEGSVGVREAQWVWLDYRQSPSLLHGRTAFGPPQAVPDAFEVDYARAIAVVSATGIDSFLTWEW